MTQEWDQGSGAPEQRPAEAVAALPGAATPRHPSDPRNVGPYAIAGRLGVGGMGTVYLARTASGTLVAVKVIRSDLAADDGFIARFRQEVAAARRVAPFCTARVLDADLEAAHPYLVTEFVEGVRLDTLVRRDGPLPLSSLQGLAVGVAAALTAIHAVGLVHRDLKPNNVLLSYFGPRVIDFGIARALDAATTLTRTGAVVGTPGWMAPEQVAGRPVTPAADVFVWGTLVVYAGTGRSPFGDGSTDALAERIVHDQPVLTGLPESLRRVVERAMDKDPATRPSAQRLVLDLAGGASPDDPRHAVTEVLQRTWVPPPLATPTAELGGTQPLPSAEGRKMPVMRARAGVDCATNGGPAGQAPAVRRQASSGRRPPAASDLQWSAPVRQWGWPAPQLPGRRPQPRWRRVLIAVVLLLLVLAAVSGGERILGWNPGSNGSGSPVDTAASAPAAIGEPVLDGTFQFVVRQISCGTETIGNDFFSLQAQGQYCLIDLQVTNIGTETAQIDDSRQYLYDDDGNEYRVLGEARFYRWGSGENLWAEINPDDTVAGSLVYDVPWGFQPGTMRLQDSFLSPGVTVQL